MSCICGGPIQERKAPANPSAYCSYWCSLVGAGKLTIEQITPWLQSNRTSNGRAT